MSDQIIVIPLDSVDSRVIEYICQCLERTFDVTTKIIQVNEIDLEIPPRK